MAPRETANNAYAKFWDDKQKVLWCVMVFSGVVNSNRPFEICFKGQMNQNFDLFYFSSILVKCV